MNNKIYFGLALCEELIAINEVKVSPELAQFTKDAKVKRFIKLSEKKLKTGKLHNLEEKEVSNLLKDARVKAYLKAATKVGQRIGWIQGGIAGALLGGVIATANFATAGIGGVGLAALALLGAVAGGVTTGYPWSKIKGILRRWKAEEEMTKGGIGSGAIVPL